jgi:asparagine synthetase B (glutamine-hydrolysing)
MREKVTQVDLDLARDMFIRRYQRLDPDGKAALALSGGTDSVTILFAMLASGHKPRCYTFYVDGIESTDLLSSRTLCKHFDLELVECKLPSDPTAIMADIHNYIEDCEYTKKTIIQCMHPWLYLYPAIKERGDILILNGLGGDELAVNQRKTMVKLHKEGEEAIIPIRSKNYSNDIRFSGGNIIRYGLKWGIENIDFYNDQEIIDFYLQFKVKALHKPVEKYIQAGAFADYYRMGKFYRKHDSYQINSGLKYAHEKILQTKWNLRDSKDMIAIYNDVRNGKYGKYNETL